MDQRSFPILLIEDDKNFREVLAFDLRARGYQVLTAANGQEGLQVVNTCSVGVILCDLKMPVLDGFAFIKAVRAWGLATPVIVLTAYPDPTNVARVKAAGAHECLAKPLNRQDLSRAIERVLDSQSATPASETFRNAET